MKNKILNNIKMDKKEAKRQYLIMRLNDPIVPEWEKKEIRQRLGIRTIVTKSDFTNKVKDELLYFVYSYLDNQLSAIRREKHINEPFESLSDNLKTVYYLSTYSTCFESDSLEQIYEVDDAEEMKSLSRAFKRINLIREYTLIDSVLNKQKIGDKDIELLQDHFWNSDIIVHEIETAIKDFIFTNIEELVSLQSN